MLILRSHGLDFFPFTFLKASPQIRPACQKSEKSDNKLSLYEPTSTIFQTRTLLSRPPAVTQRSRAPASISMIRSWWPNNVSTYDFSSTDQIFTDLKRRKCRQENQQIRWNEAEIIPGLFYYEANYFFLSQYFRSRSSSQIRAEYRLIKGYF